MTGTAYRALVVDDEVMVRHLMIRALSGYGFLCDGASNGLEAKTLAEAVQYDVVITDLRMPECHGHRLAVELLAEEQPPVLIVHTGVAEPRLARDLMVRGVDDIVYKPIDYDVLAMKVIALVDRRKTSARKERDNLSAAVPAADGDAKRNQEPSGEHADGPAHHVPTPAPQLTGAGERDSDAPRTPLKPLSSEELKAKAAQVRQVLPISHTAMDVFEMTNSNEFDAEQIAAVVARDASLSVEVLRLSNSSLFNRSSEKITDLEDAIALLGQKRVGELAVATNALGVLTPGVLSWMNVPLAWQRSLAAGMAVESLISEGGHRHLERGLMISAIMHNLGRVALGTLFPRKYEALMEMCDERKLALVDAENSVFPATHSEFLANLLAQWNVPEEICQPLKFLGEPFSALGRLPDLTRKKVGLIKTAIAIGQIAVGEWEWWDCLEFPSQSYLSTLGIHDVEKIVERTRDGLAEALAARRIDSNVDLTLGKTTKRFDPARRVAYRDLSHTSFDFLREVLSSCGFELADSSPPTSRVNGGLLVNCLDVPPREFKERVAENANGNVLIVTNPVTARQCADLPVLSVPCSFHRLRHACEDLAAKPA